MSKIAYKADLIKALRKLPDNAPIWIGVDTGEGYPALELEDIFVCNATDAPLDGDSCTNWEREYIESGEKIPKKKMGDEFIKIKMSDGETVVSGPIIVIGSRGAYKACDDYRFQRENEKELKKDMLIKARLELENKLKQIERQLELNDQK